MHSFDDLREQGDRLSRDMVLLELISKDLGSVAEGYLAEDKFGWYLTDLGTSIWDIYPGDILLEVIGK